MSVFVHFSKLSAVIILCLFSSVFAYSGGSGTSADPYLISTAADVNSIGADSNYWSKCFKLVADINMAGFTDTQYKIIGNDATKFTGTFDGNGYVIRNLTYTTTATVLYVGLFGEIGSGGVVKNLGIEDVNIACQKGYRIGGVCGYNNGGSISNCYSTGNVNGYDYVGGLCGWNGPGNITTCYSTCNVNGNHFYTGGLCGENGGNIADSYSTGNVNGISSAAGGLCGDNGGNITKCYSTSRVNGGNNGVGGLCGGNNGSITLCYSTGDVNGVSDTGGLCGGVSCGGSISNCYSTGNVIANSYVGGFCGVNFGCITNCYSSGNIDGSSYVGGLCGNNSGLGSTVGCYFLNTAGPNNGLGEPLTDEQMKQQASFAGWDFVYEVVNGTNDIWRKCFDGNGYPRMAWNTRYSGGSGTAENPYLIAIAADMDMLGAISGDWGKCFKLAADIDMSAFTGTRYKIIGNDTINFTGTFDGNGYVIRNLTYITTAYGYYNVGLFGYAYNATIKDLGIEDVNISAENSAGSLAGTAYYSTITNCYCTGRITNSDPSWDDIGGLVGRLGGGSITNCYTKINVSGKGDSIGGLCGYNDGIISKCYSNGTVSCAGGEAGGLVGRNGRSPGKIYDSYSTGVATGGNYNGGICGLNYGYITNCYSTGNRLCGHSYNTKITSCYFLDTAGYDNGFGEPLTDEQMKQESSFVNWDFSYSDGNDAVWFMAFDGYPILPWQISAADIYTDGENNFKDWTVFANYWMRDDCEIYNYYCEWSDMDFDNDVDIDDLTEFISYWLEKGIY